MLKRLKRKALYSRPSRRAIGWAQRVVLPGFEGFSVYQVSRFFFQALAKGHLPTRAAAISFKVFIAFFPAVVVLLSLIPFLPVPDLQLRLLGMFQDLFPPNVHQFFQSTLHDLVLKKHGTLLSVSFIVAIFLASNSINAILQGFSGSTNLTTWHSAFKQRMLSLGLLLVLPLLTLIAVPLLTFSGMGIRELYEAGALTNQFQFYALFAVKWVVSTLLVLVFVALLYAAGDPTTRRFKLFTPGSLLALILIMVVSQALAFVFSNITDYNALYGSIGAILAVQLWIHLNMIALLVGHELNIAIARARIQHSERLLVP